MKTLLIYNNSRYVTCKRRLIGKMFIYGLNLVFFVSAPDRLCAQEDLPTYDCEIGIGSQAGPEDFGPDHPEGLLDTDSIKVLSWNIKKGQESEWDQDLQKLSSGKDLVFLQEASLTQEFMDVIGPGRFVDVGQGWKTSGVLTAASAR